MIPKSVKILIAGGFGVGKTTMIGSVSEITPLSTEELLTEAGEGVDDLVGVEAKTTTTVALDFGRITINPQMVLYLFGTPGQNRFWFMWDDLSRGALGAIVLIDTRRLDISFASIDYFERRRIPFIVGLNCFDGHQLHEVDEVRSALAIDESIPIVACDARERDSSKNALITLLEHALSRLPAEAGAVAS